MPHLTSQERELVALGAALGSNCISCIEYHIPASRKAGLTDAQISEAIRLADKVRQVPARKVLDTALDLLSEPPATPRAEHERGSAVAQSVGAEKPALAVAPAEPDKSLVEVRSTDSTICNASKPG